MLNKYIVLGLITSIDILAFSTSYANNFGSYQFEGTPVNRQAWNAFVQEKNRKYDMAHTLEKAPFPSTVDNGNLIKVDLGKLAWAAYDSAGKLIKWGSASGGQSFCSDIGKSCKTITGTYTIYSKKGLDYKSNLFPLPKGGAPMPYCMHFSGGYALHGGAVPDFNASHGCIRVPTREARWLNQNFVTVGKTRITITY